MDEEEGVNSTSNEKKPGRKPGRQRLVDEDLILPENRREPAVNADPPPWRTSEPAPSTTPQSKPGGSSSRPVLFMLGQAPVSFRFAKIPTTGAVLGRFLNNLENSGIKETARDTRQELKDVWLHHFGPRLVEGREFGIEDVEDKSKKMIKSDRHIDDKIQNVWKEWVKLEKESRKPARASSAFFIGKQDKFSHQLKMPFNISIVNAEEIIRDSGIKDWQEETEYLRNQLSESQLGCPGSFDKRQEDRDKRIITALVTASEKEQADKDIKEDLEERRKAEVQSSAVVEDSTWDKDHNVGR